MTTGGAERRKRVLSDADIEALAEVLNETQSRHFENGGCRFDGLTRDDVLEAVKFYRSFNEALTDSKRTIRNAVIVTILGAVLGLSGWGVLAKLGKTSSGN